MVTIIILTILVSINFFWSLPLLPGFDTPFYLVEIRNLLSGSVNILNYQHLNRIIPIYIPTIISEIFKTDPIISYKITITLVYLLLCITIFYFLKNITKNKLSSTLLTSSIIISPFLITYSYTLYANFFGFLILFGFYAIETFSKLKNKDVWLGIMFGSIFYIHNFSTLSLSLIFFIYLLFKFILSRKMVDLRRIVVIFGIAGLVGSLMIFRYLPINLPAKKVDNTIMADTTRNPVITTNIPLQPALIGNEKERITKSFIDHSGKFWLLYFFTFSSAMIFLKRKEILQNKNRFMLPASIFIPSFLMSFQNVVGLNILPERFVSLVSLSTYFFYIAIITLPSLKKNIVILSAVPLLLNFLSSDSLILNKGYKGYRDDEKQVYKDISNLISKDNSIIYLSSGHNYWASYFLYGYKIQPGDDQIGCGYIKEPSFYGTENFTVAKLLASDRTVDIENYLKNLKDINPIKNKYILTDSSIGCTSGRGLSEIKSLNNIYHKDSWNLYEIP